MHLARRIRVHQFSERGDRVDALEGQKLNPRQPSSPSAASSRLASRNNEERTATSLHSPEAADGAAPLPMSTPCVSPISVFRTRRPSTEFASDISIAFLSGILVARDGDLLGIARGALGPAANGSEDAAERGAHGGEAGILTSGGMSIVTSSGIRRAVSYSFHAEVSITTWLVRQHFTRSSRQLCRVSCQPNSRLLERRARYRISSA